MEFIQRGLIGGLVAASFALTVRAEPPQAGSSFQTQLTGTHIRVVDLATNEAVMNVPLNILWQPQATESALPPTIAIDSSRPDGFDVTFTFTNETAIPLRLGSLAVSGIVSPSHSAVRAFDVASSGGAFVPACTTPGLHLAAGFFYPSSGYSPMQVIHNDPTYAGLPPVPTSPTPPPAVPYTFGVSVAYPALEYQHEIYVASRWWCGSSDWRVTVDLNPDTGYNMPAANPKDVTTRTYKVFVRVMRNQTGEHQNAWLHTVEPYREYFIEKYGRVGYGRDSKPVFVVGVAQDSACDVVNNPYGFDGRWRLDLDGFSPLTGWMSSRVAVGYDRFMVWAPSGNHCPPVYNYPFRFTSHWEEMAGTAGAAAKAPLIDFAAAHTVGLWWGNTGSYHAHWNPGPGDVAPFDPSNSMHVDAAVAELTGAAGVGARQIGLDTMSILPVWIAYPWVRQMQLLYPQFHFVTEAFMCDIMHTIAPSYQLPWNYTVLGPHFLADFLNPGHETWAHDLLGANDAAARARMQQLAAWGYVSASAESQPPLTAGTEPLSAYNAKDGWLCTTPPELIRQCNPADIANDDGTLVPPYGPIGVNSGLTSSDFFSFMGGWSLGEAYCDIANDDGSLRPPFGPAKANTGVNTADYFLFLDQWFAGCWTCGH
jgi:hypothetical protein